VTFLSQRDNRETIDSGPSAAATVPLDGGRWLVAQYWPTSLFSLKMSQATSSVGKTLLVPTMYAIKMALVDAAFRLGLSDEECASVVTSLAFVPVRIRPPERAVVTHTFVKIRQEPKTPDPLKPYGSSIAYREMVHYAGEWQWAFDTSKSQQEFIGLLKQLLVRVSYIGRRGSFVQFMGMEWTDTLPEGYTQPNAENGFSMPARWHVATLDDFGPEASLGVLSSYSSARAIRGRHRIFVQTIVPLGLVNAGPGFSEYSSG